jgi:hypothetical protein
MRLLITGPVFRSRPEKPSKSLKIIYFSKNCVYLPLAFSVSTIVRTDILLMDEWLSADGKITLNSGPQSAIDPYFGTVYFE